MLKEKLKLKGKKLILGSQSPRRKELLASLNLDFDVFAKEVDETYPNGLSNKEIAEYLANLKSIVFKPLSNEIIITADTIVCVDNEILGKPSTKTEASQMLKKLSARAHEVITGVSIKSMNNEYTFSDTTSVHFGKLTYDEIDYYIDTYKPYDKAGSYGIQEWIGQIGITKIEGSYFNVMGLPVHRVYAELLKIC
ncbi:MAG: septum formation protein Maf [Flavobacteriales bacterium]|nr:septum formation protein Maf [Flavobacteriales bacterium]